MKLYILASLFFLILLGSCSTDEDATMQNQADPLANRTSSCENVIGYTGLYWDMANGDTAAYGALPELPIIANPGGQFIHSQQPSLGFILPQGFTGFEVQEPSTVGVNVFRDDNQVLYRYVPLVTVFQVGVPTQTIIEQEINTMLSFYGFQGQPEVLCTSFRQGVNTFPQEFNARLLRFNGMIAQVWVLGTYFEGTATSSFSISVSIAPEAEYETQIQETFLPFIFQLFVRPDGGFVDNDMDGFDVLVDPDDNDPSVP